MSGSGRERSGVYVYGVTAADDARDVFDGATGIDPQHDVVLIREGALAAVASVVPLDEFGAPAIEANLRDPTWLEEKVRRHDAVLEAAVGTTTVLPFRFGAIYVSEQHVREMLADRNDLVASLDRLAGKLEFGVGGFVDVERLRQARAAERGIAPGEPASGADYMRRRQLERELDETIDSLLADWAHLSHESLTLAADDGAANALRRPDVTNGRRMFLNGAYLVETVHQERFQAALAELRARFGGDGADYELTGPWPPYNFVEDRREQ